MRDRGVESAERCLAEAKARVAQCRVALASIRDDLSQAKEALREARMGVVVAREGVLAARQEAAEARRMVQEKRDVEELEDRFGPCSCPGRGASAFCPWPHHAEAAVRVLRLRGRPERSLSGQGVRPVRVRRDGGVV